MKTSTLDKVQSILINKSRKFILDIPSQHKVGENIDLVATMQANLEKLGYGLSKEFILNLSHAKKDVIIQTNDLIVDTVKKMLGAYVRFTPMYPNFPKQVMEASELELFINAIVHYSGDLLGFRYIPIYEEEKRKKLPKNDRPKPHKDEDSKFRVIELGSDTDVANLFKIIISGNTSISESDKEILPTLYSFLNAQNLIKDILADIIVPQKENNVLLAELVYSKTSNIDAIKKYFNSPTDVLRYVALTFTDAKDISLAEKPRFKNIPRNDRRKLLTLIEHVLNNHSVDSCLDEISNRQEIWIRLNEKLHAGEFKKQFPKSLEFFTEIHTQKKILSHMGRVDGQLNKFDYFKAIDIAAEKPGVLGRNLRKIASHIDEAKISKREASKSTHYLIETFGKVAEQIATPILLQIYNQFKDNSKKQYRTFLPKGVAAKFFTEDTTAKQLGSNSISFSEIAEEALVNRFKKLPSLGNVFVDENLKEQLVPFALRSTTKALKTNARGSKIQLEEKDTFRLFLWWKQPENDRTDIDLSVIFYNENYQKVEHCSFTNLKGKGYTHSGDITSAPNGACEFIDIDKSTLREDAKYAVMVINSYSGQPYHELPECFAGYMERTKAQAGKIYSPRTVENKFDLTSDTQVVVPMAMDIHNNKLIWLDLSVNTYDFWNVVEKQDIMIGQALKGFDNFDRPTLYDLFHFHAKARGVIVDKKEDADSVFSMYEGVTPFDYNIIASEYLANEVKEVPAKKVKSGM